MKPFSSSFPPAPIDKYWKIWVLAPQLQSEDPNLEYYYDFTQSIEEYTRVFAVLQLTWQWQPVTQENFGAILSQILTNAAENKEVPVFLNLCDGDEINGTPGISVVNWLTEHHCIYSGADAFFYRITTSKIPMKEAFDEAGVATPPWKIIRRADYDTATLFAELGSPIILKPAISGGSMGVGVKNVVSTPEAAAEQIKNMFKGYRGWNLAADGIIAEAFIAGPEFTTLISGSAPPNHTCKVYIPVERVFHNSLSEKEKFLSFDRLWEIYEEESPMPESGDFYQYAAPHPNLIKDIQEISLQAYEAVKGKGYTRADIRMDAATGKYYVLEVNAQCGLSEDENYTSIGAILRVNETSFPQLIEEVLLDAIQRNNGAFLNQSASL